MGRGTRRRGKPGRPGVQSEPVRLSDQGAKGGLRTGPGDQTGPRLQGVDDFGRTNPGEPGRDFRTTWPSATEHRKPGVARIQPTFAGFARRYEGHGSEPQRPSPTRTWRGDAEEDDFGRNPRRPPAQFWAPHIRFPPAPRPPRLRPCSGAGIGQVGSVAAPLCPLAPVWACSELQPVRARPPTTPRPSGCAFASPWTHGPALFMAGCSRPWRMGVTPVET